MLVVLGLMGLVLPARAHAQSCNPEGTACIDTAAPLMPAQVIDFRVEAGATRVLAKFSQFDDAGMVIHSHVTLSDPELVSAGPPGGQDAYRTVLFGKTPPSCVEHGGCIPGKPVVDGRTIIEVRYKSPTTGQLGTFHEAEYEAIAPVAALSASILTPGKQLVAQLSFEARREVRVTATVTLSGKRSRSGKSWRRFASESSDEIVGTGTHQFQMPSRKRKCPRRYDKCKANLKGGIFTEAAGFWWSSGDAAAKLKPLR